MRLIMIIWAQVTTVSVAGTTSDGLDHAVYSSLSPTVVCGCVDMDFWHGK
jgi:hypothetical protein